jgi:hypothetical protein
MLKLLFALTLAGALAGAAAFVPLRGSTLVERWSAAPTAASFVARGWRDLKVACGFAKETSRGARPQASRPGHPGRPSRPGPPSEAHSDRDRAALERIVAEHASP